MNAKQKSQSDFDEPLIWIYDPRYPVAIESELAKDHWADFDHPMKVVDKTELASLIKHGHKIEFV